jgi:hypothetical protein
VIGEELFACNWSSHRVKSAGSLFVLLVSIVAFSGCDIFSTRTPQLPNAGSTFIWKPATDITTLIDVDLTGALQVLDATNYAKAFVDPTDSVPSGLPKTYTFVPRSGINGINKTVFNTWTVQSEQQSLTKLASLLAQNSKITVIFTNETTNQSNATTATVTLNYNLLLPVNQSSGVPPTVSGNLQFQVELVTTSQSIQEWRIVQWNDFADPTGSNPAWTDLKLDLSS